MNVRPDLDTEKGPSAADPSLHRLLLTEIDGLEEALATERLLAARMLLHWASNAANFALDSQIESLTTRVVGVASAGEAYYEQFLPNQGAVYCDGMAVFYDHVLESLGYDSFTINFGELRNDLNHVCVSVSVSDGMTWKHYLFDPTFNATFHDRSERRQLDFFELIDTLDTGTSHNVEAVSRSVEARDWISIGPAEGASLRLREVIGDRYVYERADGGLRDYLERIGPGLTANGYRQGLTGLLQLMSARMFRLGPCECLPAVEDFANKLQVRDISFGHA